MERTIVGIYITDNTEKTASEKPYNFRVKLLTTGHEEYFYEEESARIYCFQHEDLCPSLREIY